MKSIDLRKTKVPRWLRDMIPRETCLERHVMPVSMDCGVMIIATCDLDPDSSLDLEDIPFSTRFVRACYGSRLATKDEIDKVINGFYKKTKGKRKTT
jgi:hypothetical protein